MATWGAISWRGTAPAGSRVELFTRSGNTETPDDTWSAWSAAYTTRDGSPITSPKARYLQWRAVLTGKSDGPVLTSVTAAYLQRNLRPQVRSVTVHPPGIVFQKPFTTGDPDLAGFDDQTTPDRKLASGDERAAEQLASPSLGRRTYQKGLQTLIWRADDENDDELSYDVQYRREGETAWKALRRDVTDPILVWDTTTVPERHLLRQDRRVGRAVERRRDGARRRARQLAFEIDNTPPTIAVGSARFERRPHDRLVRRQGRSLADSARRVLAGRPAVARACSRSTASPTRKTEHYELAIDGELGPRGLTLRATDAMNNVATAQVDPLRRP